MRKRRLSETKQRKLREVVPSLGGLAMLGVSFLVSSWVWMSLACLAMMAGGWQLMHQSD